MKIVIGTGQFGEDYAEKLGARFPEATFTMALTDPAEVREIVDADAFLGWPEPEAIAAAQRLRWIHVPGMGINNTMRSPGIAESGIVVTNSPGAHTSPIADHVMFFVLSLAHQGRRLLDDQRARRWNSGSYERQLRDLDGSAMLLIGLGGIGRAVFQRAQSFGMQVSAIDPNPTDVPAGVREVGGEDRLDALLAETDWLVVTVPVTPGTRNMIDARRIGLLKQGASVIVISRGGIVDEDALAEALSSGHLFGAGLDATEVEPLPDESPLWDLDNVLISPHCSGVTPSNWKQRRQTLEDQVRRFVEGRPLAYICDLERGY